MAIDVNTRVAKLADAHSWPRDQARKILAISGSCMLFVSWCLVSFQLILNSVDATVGVAIGDIRDNVIASFNELVFSGPLSGETVRGVCFDLVDAKVHHDSAHRRADQICPMMKRACFAAILTGSPRYIEPVFAVCPVINTPLISEIPSG